MLEENGFNVRCAYSGQELFAGLQVLKRLKGNPVTASIPVILLSVKALDEDIRVGYKWGADHYITKPFTGTQLLDGINLIFSGNQRHSNRVN